MASAEPQGGLLELTSRGLYCRAGDFYIDPWRPVERAVVTHAHADHARPGSEAYLVAATGQRVFRRRLGEGARIESLAFGEGRRIGSVRVSLHPAGHILGSAQIRLESGGEVWVVSGDYKLESDPTCTPFEPVRCHGFVTESTFGLPIYRWPEPDLVAGEINNWWQTNRESGRQSVLLSYALGKAQRLLASVDASIGPIYAHGAVQKLNDDYRASGVDLPATAYATPGEKAPSGSLIVAPPAASGSPWLRRFGDVSLGFASGWMKVRGPRRRRAVDRGFVFSDHADWPGLLRAIAATGAERVWVTHGFTEAMVRWLGDEGLEATRLETRFEGERADEADSSTEEETHTIGGSS